MRSIIVAIVALQALNGASASSLRMSGNPIRKVVSLLQGMAEKIEAQGEKEKQLYDKFMCYCKTGQKELKRTIGENSDKGPAVQSDLEEAQSTVAKLKEELKSHGESLDSAKKAMDEATGVREKEREAFNTEAAEKQGFITALEKSIPAIKTGMAGVKFLQTESAAAATIKKAALNNGAITDDDREAVVAFLSMEDGSSDKYVPVGSEVVGIMQNMKEDYEKDLAGITDTENGAVKLYEELIAAKKKEVRSLRTTVQKKTQRVGDIAVDIVHMKHDLKESGEMVAADQEMLEKMGKDCEGKTAEFEERQKTSSEELQAIHDTVKILSDDDALDIFKATLSSSGGAGSLLQVQKKDKIARRLQNAKAAKSFLQAMRSRSDGDKPEVRFLEMALSGKQVDFGKVTKMIDGMIALMKQEQADDDSKKQYCQNELHNVAAKSQALKRSIKEQEAQAEDRSNELLALAEDSKSLKNSIAELDKLVDDATAERKEQNEEFQQLMSSNSAAKEILEFAKTRLSKFYNPKGLDLAATQSSTEKEVFPTSATESLSPISLSGRGEFDQAALFKVLDERRPSTAFLQTNQRRLADSNQVISMMNQLVFELTTEMKLAGKDEDHAQAEYEDFMTESQKKRATYAKGITVKESAKSETEEMKVKEKRDLQGSANQMEAVETEQVNLHDECDWILQNFDLRRNARADEADNLKQAKAVLHGSDYSFVQSHSHAFLSRKHHA